VFGRKRFIEELAEEADLTPEEAVEIIDAILGPRIITLGLSVEKARDWVAADGVAEWERAVGQQVISGLKGLGEDLEGTYFEDVFEGLL
jgi:aspartate 1-decarboxylase